MIKTPNQEVILSGAKDRPTEANVTPRICCVIRSVSEREVPEGDESPRRAL